MHNAHSRVSTRPRSCATLCAHACACCVHAAHLQRRPALLKREVLSHLPRPAAIILGRLVRHIAEHDLEILLLLPVLLRHGVQPLEVHRRLGRQGHRLAEEVAFAEGAVARGGGQRKRLRMVRYLGVMMLSSTIGTRQDLLAATWAPSLTVVVCRPLPSSRPRGHAVLDSSFADRLLTDRL